MLNSAGPSSGRMGMVSVLRIAAGVAAMIAVIAILGFYFGSLGTGGTPSVSSSQVVAQTASASQGGVSSLASSTTITLNCPKDGDSDHEELTTTTTSWTGSSGVTTTQIGICVVDNDGDGY